MWPFSSAQPQIAALPDRTSCPAWPSETLSDVNRNGLARRVMVVIRRAVHGGGSNDEEGKDQRRVKSGASLQ